jgi:hypothetical protein
MAHGYQSISRYTERARKSNLIETVASYKRQDVSRKLLFQINALSLVESTCVMRWMRNDFRATVDEMTASLESIVPAELHELLTV